MVADLLLILELGVGDDDGDEDGKDVFEQVHGEVELCPVMSLLHDVKDVACWKNVNMASRAHWNTFTDR